MNRRSRALRYLLLFAASAIFSEARAAAGDLDAERLAHFENNVRPLLIEHCIECHGPKKAESGLRLDTPATLLEGGASGPAISPGHPQESLIVKALRSVDGLEMPPGGELPDHEIAAIEQWILEGAVWPDAVTLAADGSQLRSGSITAEDRRFWSFQPIRDPQPPLLDDVTAASDIDRFVLQRLRDAKLQPTPAANKRQLIRRATFDLTGLPPTPDEIRDFLNDDASDAFTKVVDRLLDSRAYGDRWGRHWLDVVRYADTAGETADYPTPLAYKYRNWVINAFNADMPYDAFVRQQLAGDILAERMLTETRGASSPREPSEEELATYREMRTATGFIAISRRFGFDVENYHHLTIQDTIDVVGQSMLGLTLGCARCHDHKYDPVNAEDYYAWYGIFDSTRYSFPGSEEKKRPYDLVPALPAELVEQKQEAGPYEVIYGAIEKESPANTRIQLRGEKDRLGEEVPRRNLEIFDGELLPADAGSGRLQLAEWLTGDDNPLLARVMVNRIWQHHFGRGLVATVNDFGVRGDRPSHPDLLDWLASRFKASGYSIKAMHRLIMKTAAYQRSSAFDAGAAERDPEGRLLWRFNRRRLSAEEIRDAMLFVSGNLDPTMGGEHPFPSTETWGFTQHNPFYDVYPTNRRSVYLMQQRLKRHPFLGLFDGADTNASTGRRELTTVPTQALFLMNNAFVHEQASAFARRLIESTDDDTDRVELAYKIALGRAATADEQADAATFLTKYREAALTAQVSPADTGHTAWDAFARTLLVRNEFLFVD